MATLEYRGPTPDDPRKPRFRLKWTHSFLAVSILLFLVWLTQNAFEYGDKSNHFQSCFLLLLIGWFGLFDGYYEWLANPALLAMWILMTFRISRPLAIVAGLISLAFALSFLHEKLFPLDEAGNIGNVAGRATVYWLWIASIAAALIGCVVLQIVDLRRPTSVAE